MDFTNTPENRNTYGTPLNRVFQTLGGYWYDRSETDEEIIKEMLIENNPEHMKQIVLELEEFIATNDLSEEEKREFIKEEVSLYFPPDKPETPSKWLKEVILKMKKAMYYWSIVEEPQDTGTDPNIRADITKQELLRVEEFVDYCRKYEMTDPVEIAEGYLEDFGNEKAQELRMLLEKFLSSSDLTREEKIQLSSPILYKKNPPGDYEIVIKILQDVVNMLEKQSQKINLS